MAATAIAVARTSRPAPTNSAVAWTSTNSPDSASDSGVIPTPMSITRLITRPIIAWSTRRWIHEIAMMFA